MPCVTLYGLDDARRVVLTKIFSADPERLAELAASHLERCVVVEVWTGQSRLLHLDRALGAAPAWPRIMSD